MHLQNISCTTPTGALIHRIKTWILKRNKQKKSTFEKNNQKVDGKETRTIIQLTRGAVCVEDSQTSLDGPVALEPSGFPSVFFGPNMQELKVSNVIFGGIRQTDTTESINQSITRNSPTTYKLSSFPIWYISGSGKIYNCVGYSAWWCICCGCSRRKPHSALYPDGKKPTNTQKI